MLVVWSTNFGQSPLQFLIWVKTFLGNNFKSRLKTFVYITIMGLNKGIFKELVNELCDLENILETFYGKEKSN